MIAIPEPDMFKRHLVALKALPSYDWLLFTDADVLFVNQDKGLEPFIKAAGSADIIFPTQWARGEIVAGSYLV